MMTATESIKRLPLFRKREQTSERFHYWLRPNAFSKLPLWLLTPGRRDFYAVLRGNMKRGALSVQFTFFQVHLYARPCENVTLRVMHSVIFITTGVAVLALKLTIALFRMQSFKSRLHSFESVAIFKQKMCVAYTITFLLYITTRLTQNILRLLNLIDNL